MTTAEILTIAAGNAATAAGGFFVGRRKKNAEADGVELKNVEKAIEIWRKLANDLKTEVIALRNEVSELRTENRSLREEVSELRTENGPLREKIDHLEKTLSKI